MHGRLDLASVGRVAALGGGIIGAAQLSNLAGRILDDVSAFDEIGIAQPHFGARGQPEKLLRRAFHEVVLLDIEFAAECDAARAGSRIVRVIDGLELLDLAFRIVLDHDFQRPQHRHPPQR